jgi:hypothetical protein
MTSNAISISKPPAVAVSPNRPVDSKIHSEPLTRALLIKRRSQWRLAPEWPSAKWVVPARAIS